MARRSVGQCTTSEFDAQRGMIAFPMGPIRMTADDKALTVIIELAEGADVDRFKQSVAEHLDRFAFREAPLSFHWQWPPARGWVRLA